MSQIHEPTTVEKMDPRYCGKRYRAEFCFMNIVDTQKKLELILRIQNLSNKLKSLDLLSVHQSWDDTGDCGDLVDITREIFKVMERACKRPYEILYLSVHCDVSPLALASVWDATRVFVRGFLIASKPILN